MNRKNLTCAVLAGLAGVAGLAGTAQAVNLNPDGLGQVLLYPYYTANAGNQTILSVVNTTDHAKAVKVRFLEGFNSREVLDFNLYMSHHDVWVAAIDYFVAPGASQVATPHLIIPDSSCTVPYLYQFGIDLGYKGGRQPFLDLAYTGLFEDGGPTHIQRTAEGHIEMIEMGTLVGESALDVTHMLDAIPQVPLDCAELSKKWTQVVGGENGIWFDEANFGAEICDDPIGDDDPVCITTCEANDQACTDTTRASGGLFGGAAIVNPLNGTMYSYDAKAIQGFDKTTDGLHFEPGTIFPSLASGSETDSWVFFGVPQNRAVNLEYRNSVDAVSSVLMHEYLMNEYTQELDLFAGTEWIVTFPTKSFYADPVQMVIAGVAEDIEVCADPVGEAPPVCKDVIIPRRPFTHLFGAEVTVNDEVVPLCELVSLRTWNREEDTFDLGGPDPIVRPPVVSPSPPDPCAEGFDELCSIEAVFQLCNEVNVLQFGIRDVFNTPTFDEGSLLLNVEDEFQVGWGRLNLGFQGDDGLRFDNEGLVGLPVAGFAAYEFENEFLGGGDIQAFYGGLFQHKYNVRRIGVDID
jgi:hypothetical protein